MGQDSIRESEMHNCRVFSSPALQVSNFFVQLRLWDLCDNSWYWTSLSAISSLVRSKSPSHFPASFWRCFFFVLQEIIPLLLNILQLCCHFSFCSSTRFCSTSVNFSMSRNSLPAFSFVNPASSCFQLLHPPPSFLLLQTYLPHLQAHTAHPVSSLHS